MVIIKSGPGRFTGAGDYKSFELEFEWQFIWVWNGFDNAGHN